MAGMERTADDFIPVRRRRGRRPRPQPGSSTESLEHSKFSAANTNKSKRSNQKNKPSNETRVVVNREERQRIDGGHIRRCICRWVMSYGRYIDSCELQTDYDEMGCAVCRRIFLSEESRLEHFIEHGSEFTNLLKTAGKGRITRNAFRLEITYLPKYSRMVMRLENDSNAVLILRSVYLFQLNQRLDSTLTGAVRMSPGFTYEIEYSIGNCVPNHVYTVVLMGTIADSQVELVEQYHVQMLKSTRIQGTPLKLDNLPYHPVPEYLIAVYRNNFEHSNTFNRLALLCLEKLRENIKQGLTVGNYVEHLRQLNMIEDYDLQTIYATYTIKDATIRPAEQHQRYIIGLDQFEVPPTLLEEDGYVRITVNDGKTIRCGRRGFVDGHIHTIDDRDVVIVMDQPIRYHLPCKVDFSLNRTQYKLEYNALNLISRIDLEKLFFPKSLPKKKRPIRQTEFRWFQPTIATNQEQMTAIRNIVNMTSFPAPYILFGPPGTGKTSTIVEAVLQIWKNQPKAHVLVAASSNFACDELTKRLQVFVPEEDIFRFYSRSYERKIDGIDIEILEISNLATGVYEIPSYEHVYRSRITVSTVTNCGRFAQARIRPKFFDYIFIDECGSAKEVSALVPIAGIGTEGAEVHASVIMAGDPKQLGPVVRKEYLKQTVHNTSMLERLMLHGIYRRHKGRYNPYVITKLLDNYRSHAALIQYSNNSFYEGELRARASHVLTDWAIGWDGLPNPAFPIIMHSVVGVTQRESRSCSLYNKQEARRVLMYIQKMLNDGINDRPVREGDIGIVAPYTRQVEYIKQGCRNYGWDNIEVGSAEQYQGREKPIIIISTVRSELKHVGFLSNSKRLNVVTTRARALMIIVGNPNTLQRDPHWYRFLRYIADNQGVRGVEFELKKPEIDLSGQPFSFALEEFDFA